ncbi:MAG TPA: 50S ribosomal protein L28 [Patescibacteria group bacterium]|nr:50S ribosomal protein L28 [Patescibacteria group bacterium]
MAFKCDNCGKGISWGHRVSHAKNRTNHAFRPNIQKKKIVVDGRSMSVKLCASCIKTLKKVKKVKAPKEEAPVVAATA